MDRRTYVLLTGVSLVLVAALLGTPLWDHWYYNTHRSSPGASVPMAAIVAAPAESSPPSLAGMFVPPAPAARTPVPAAPSPAWTTAPPAARPERTRAMASTGAKPPDGDSTSRLVSKTASQRVRAPIEAAAVAPEGRSVENRMPSPEPPSPVPAAVFYAPQTAPGAPQQPAATKADVRSPDPSDGSRSSRIQPHTHDPGEQDPAPGEAPVVSLVPEPAEAWPGGPIVVTLHVSGAVSMSSLPFHLRFDPDVLEFVGSETGPALSGSHEAVLLASVNPNRPGDLAVGLSLVESSGLFSGSGALVHLQFKALAPGETELQFERATLRGATSQPVDARFEKTRITVQYASAPGD